MRLNSIFIQKLKKGDEKAYSYLMDKYYQSLCVFANVFTKDSAMSEDIVQNVVIKFWSNRKKIDDNIHLKKYLHKSVYNEFINQYRKNKNLISLEEKHLEALKEVVENDENDIVKMTNKLNEEINKLPKKCRKVLLLSKKEGLTHDEIAKYLEISNKTVEGHISRAFKILYDSIGEQIESLLLMFFGINNPQRF
jgi:RNA polymerase sigma-70 factor (ECF subfamily)